MPGPLEGRLALVTGASRGIGAATAGLVLVAAAEGGSSRISIHERSSQFRAARRRDAQGAQVRHCCKCGRFA